MPIMTGPGIKATQGAGGSPGPTLTQGLKSALPTAWSKMELRRKEGLFRGVGHF